MSTALVFSGLVFLVAGKEPGSSHCIWCQSTGQPLQPFLFHELHQTIYGMPVVVSLFRRSRAVAGHPNKDNVFGGQVHCYDPV